jgi:hypothetical protein
MNLFLITTVFIFGLIVLILFLNKRIDATLLAASEKLNFQYLPSKNIFKEKRIFGELEGYKCEIEIYTRTHGRSTTTYISFFAYFPESFDMGLKMNWRGKFDGDDEYLSELFVNRNKKLIDMSKKNLRRLSIEDTYVNSRKILFIKYYKSDEIVKTMYEVLNLAKSIK